MLGRALVRFSARHSRAGLRQQRSLPIVQFLALRAYATPGRPKSVVGQPSRPVKRNVKRAAAKPSDGTSAAERKVAAKRSSPARKTLTAEQKVAKAKKKEAVQARALKQKEAKQARSLKSKAAAKARSDREKLAELKKVALDPPKAKGGNAYITFASNYLKGKLGSGSTAADVRANLGERVKEASAAWKNCSPADIEHWNHVTHQANEAQRAEYKRWVESHSPEEISRANIARVQLQKKYPKQKTRKWAKINDERAPKGALAPYLLFSVDRNSSGDFNNIRLPDRAKLIAQEWKSLSSGEKDKYQQLGQKDRQRFVEEYSTVFGHSPGVSSKPVSVSA